MSNTNYGPPQGEQPRGQWQPPQQFYAPPQQQPSMQQWQQPMYPPPMQQPPPKKKWHQTPIGILIIIGAILGVLMICGSIGNLVTQASKSSTGPDTANIVATTAPTQAIAVPTQAPTKPLTWKTVQTFSGNGAKKTGTFTVPDHWRINWTCKPDPVIGAAPLYISTYNADGTMGDFNAVGTTCKAGNTSGTSEEHQGGQMYLDINTGLDYVIVIQALE